MKNSVFPFAVATLVSCWFAASSVAATIYVDVNAVSSDTTDGSSWELAYPNLGDALEAASEREGSHEIWIAEGVYTPGSERNDTFLIGSSISLYGGFVGDEDSLDDRVLSADNPTILSGDVTDDDFENERGRVNNAYTVVTVEAEDAVVIDGVTIYGGYANSEGTRRWSGGGLFMVSGDITVRDARFEYNHAGGSGGAALLGGTGSAIFEDVDFNGNDSQQYGGAIETEGSVQLTARRCDFRNNVSSSFGGAISTGPETPTLIEDSQFTGNGAGSGSGAINFGTDAGVGIALNIDDCVFDDNSAKGQGGAIGNSTRTERPPAPVEIRRSTFTSNVSDSSGGAIAVVFGAPLSVFDSEFEANTSARGGSIYMGSYTDVRISDSTFANDSAGLGGSLCFEDAASDAAVAVVLERVSFRDGSATDGPGGAIFATGFSSFTGTDVEFDNCRAQAAPGGGAYLYSVLNEGADGEDELLDPSSVQFTRLVATNNLTTSVGGGVMAYAGSVVVTDATFTGNEANDPGGAAYFGAGSIVLTDLWLEDNRSNNSVGGGLYLGRSDASDSAVEIREATFLGNRSYEPGGAVYMTATSFEGENLTFEGNETVANQGGGMSADVDGDFALAGALFANNRALRNGGGLHVSAGGLVTISGAVFEDNRSGISGGGAYLTAGGVATLSEVIAQRNEAVTSAGGIWLAAGDIALTNLAALENRVHGSAPPTGRGGGLVLLVQSEVPEGIEMTHCTIADNLANGWASQIEAAGKDLELLNTIVRALDTSVSAIERRGEATDPLNVIVFTSSLDTVRLGQYVELVETTPVSGAVRFQDVANGDYRLAYDSGLIDVGNAEHTGDLAIDALGSDRVVGDGSDLGAFEFACNNRGLMVDAVCVCIDGLSGPECGRCDPAELDCTALCNGNGDHHEGTCECDFNWDGLDCLTCAEGWDGTSCLRCDPASTDCSTFCNGNGDYLGEGECECSDNFTGTQCEGCDLGWAGDGCSDCAQGFDGDGCNECATNFAGGDCNECVLGWAGSDCNECAEHVTGDDCDQCAEGWSGRYCDIPTAEQPEPDATDDVDMGGSSDIVDEVGQGDGIATITVLSPSESDDPRSSGCGCSVNSRKPQHRWLFGLLGIGLIAIRRRSAAGD